jgi:hypothetical protein
MPPLDRRPLNRLQLSKSAPPPTALPMYGVVRPEDVSFIGRTNYTAALEEKRFIFGIKRHDRKRHVYLIGKAGVGKSKLMELLLRQDISFDYGLCLIDPHNETIEEALSFVPENRVADVVLIDPLDTSHSIAFNPLADVAADARHQLVEGIVDGFKQYFGDSWRGSIEHVARFALLALIEYPGATIGSIYDMVRNEPFRANVVQHVTDPVVRQFWETRFASWSEEFHHDALLPLLDKLSQLLANPFLKQFLTIPDNKVNFHDLLRENKIVLVNLAKNRMGEQNAAFFGAIILAKLKEAGIARASTAPEKRKDFYIYIDELPGMATATFEQLLAEAKTYGFCLTMANQYFGQLSPSVQAAVLGHVGNMIVFRVAGEDAVRLKPEMAPVFDVRDMVNLGAQQFYIRLTIDGEAYDPFSGETLKLLPPPHQSLREQIIEASRKRYSL